MKTVPLNNDTHEFEKINSFSVMDHAVEIHKCKKCGLSGRKYGALKLLVCDSTEEIVLCTNPLKASANFVRTKKN